MTPGICPLGLTLADEAGNMSNPFKEVAKPDEYQAESTGV